MNAELQAIRDAMDKTTGRDEEQARVLADAYVADHPDEFAMLATMTIESCVGLVDFFRDQNDEDSQWRIETWLLHHFESQTIGGPITAKVRIVQQ